MNQINQQPQIDYGKLYSLPPEVLFDLGRSLIEHATRTRGAEGSELLFRRAEALKEIEDATEVISTAKRTIEYNVVIARQSGASWADIGMAEGVNRDVSYKRHSKLYGSS